ncbi:hypothetical protein SAMN05216374_0972 [Tardiphaga sp. OK246]|uniref:hypothetical protein n=1 Tax=Tardiphaga sp. OK246 TaxID=1855307 RepID=UPI000B6E4F76|nr:hypothetical protein [Tardiphaga sp. OK246]SNS36076.1 hypothetical protein SAMN05216374_0972 [Tardiphaga sp. OK246]
MASVIDAIRRLVIQASAPGAAQATAELNALAAAQGGVAVASAVTERATTSLDSKFAAIERRYNSALRNQQEYAKIQRDVNAAVAQNPALQDRANAVLASAADRLGQVSGAQKAFGIATQTANLQIAAFASGLGLTGQVLSAFGPAGFGAAVALGAVQAALTLASDKAHEMAQKSKEIFEFSEATGLSTRQFQALRSEAGKFGIDSESLATGLTKFTAGFENLRLGSGDLLTQIRRINPAIAEQMQQTTDAATAFTLFGRAVEQTDNIFQRNALLKAGMGRGAATFGAFFESAPDVAKLTAAFDAAGRGIDANLIVKLKQLQIDIDKTKSATNTVFAGMFGTATLEGEKAFAEGLLELAKYAASFKLSDDFRKYIDFKMSPAATTALNITAGAGAGILAGGATGAVTGATIGAFGGPIGLGAGAAIGALGGAIVGAIYSAVQEIKPGSLVGATAPSMANFRSPANSYSTFQAPATPAVAKTPQAELADMEKRVALLGAAATATEKYDAALAKLKLGQDGVTLSGKDLDRATAALGLEKATAMVAAHNSALGMSLPVQDAVNAKTLELQRLQQQGAGLTSKQIEDQRSMAREQALGTSQIKAQIDAITVQSATAGMSAGAAAAYTAKQSLLNDAIRNHKDLTTQDRAEIDKQAEAYGRVVAAAEKQRVAGQISFDRQTAFLSPQDVQIAQQLRGIYGDDVPRALKSAEAEAIRLNDSFKGINDTIRDAAQSLTKDFVSGLASGKSMMSALGDAASNLSAKLTDKAITSLFSGDLVGAAVSGFGALISGIFGNNSKKREQEEKDTKAAMERMIQYQQRATLASLDTNTREGSLAAQEANFQAERLQEAQNGNRALDSLLTAQNAERLALQKQWDDKEIEAAKAKADAIAQRTLSAQDRLFTAMNDNTTLEGQLAAADRQYARERLDEMKTGGEALLDLVAAQEAERADIIKKYNEELLTFVQGVAKTIRDYLQGLKTSSNSTLSPQQQLAAAQSNFAAQLALAQGGDRDALTGITQVAQTLLDQAKSFYASSGGYTDIYNQVTAALTGLANISAGTVSDADRIVAAVNDSKTATTGTITTTSLQEQSLLNAMNLVLGAINTLADRFVNAINGLGALTSTIGSNQSYWLAQIYAATAKSAANSGGSFWSWLGFQDGGRIPGYAGGGMVGNGMYNVDSVVARYAGGGDIALAGGEFVNRATSVNAATMPMLQFINDNGRLPAQGSDSAARENARAIAQSNRADADRVIAKLDELIDAINDTPAKNSAATRRLVEGLKQRAAS